MHKGFTLVELLAVIVILGLVAVITTTVVSNLFSSSKESLYKTQVGTIEDAARKWGVENHGALPQVTGSCFIKLQTLINDRFLSDKAKTDPRNKSVKLNGCIKVTYDEVRNKYTYTYQEASCSSNICTA